MTRVCQQVLTEKTKSSSRLANQHITEQPYFQIILTVLAFG